MKKFIKLDNNYIEKYGTGKLTAIINRGIEKWGRSIDDFLNQSINVLISFLFTGFMLYKSDDLFLVGFVFLYIFIYFCAYYLNLGALKARRERRDSGNEHTKNLVKLIMNKQEIMQSSKINYELGVLDYYKNKEIFYNKKLTNYLTPLFEGPNILLSLVIISLLYYLGNSYLNGILSLASIVGVVSALILMKRSVERGIDFFKNFTKEFTDIEKLWDFFDSTPEMKGYKTGKEFNYKKGKIEIEKLSYGYVKGTPVFKNFSLKLKGGKVTAFVGNSGSGKSTLVKLIAGYIRADKGNVIIDEQKLNKVSLKSYYKNIGYLTQEPSVFDGTILDNLTYAIETSSEQSTTNEIEFKEKLDNILKLAKCEFIYDLVDGINTEIGERGIRLSGGQRQRLAIAKIFLKDPKIIILDEPTSALDSFSEEQITKAMHNLFKGRTVIVIAHRLQTVKDANDIILFENGEIKERGIHSELVKLKGQYKKMLDLQSGF